MGLKIKESKRGKAINNKLLSLFVLLLFLVTTIQFNIPVQAVDTNLKVHYIDVGQADAILIQQDGKNMLIDAGNNADDKLVVDYLKKQSVKTIDVLIGTHPDEDHIGGLDTVIKSFGIGKIYMPKVTKTTDTFKDVVTAITDKKMKVSVPKAGEIFKIGNAECTILGPNSSEYKESNNYSIVIKLKYKDNSFLFMGDAEDISENEMLKNKLDISADVLKVGHHGSSSSTTANFLNKVNPKYAIVSVGKDNSYQHPNQEVMNLLKTKKIPLYRTDEVGTIVVASDGKTISFDKKLGTYNIGTKTEKTTGTTPVTPVKAPVKTTVKPPVVATVYITNSGKKYHKDGCSSLSKSKIAISLKDAKAKGYTPCDKCKPVQ